MNDFTKEELNLLIFHIGLTMDGKSLALARKIKFMIDTYDEPITELENEKEWEFGRKWEKYLERIQNDIEKCSHVWRGDSYQVTHCKKCGKFYK